MKKFILSLSLFFGLASMTAFAQTTRVDIKGSKDHPLVGRYAGSWLVAQVELPFGASKLPQSYELGKDKEWNQWLKSITVEGTSTRLYYVGPKGKSAIEIQRNYETAVAQNGAVKLLACNTKESCQNVQFAVFTSAQRSVYDLPRERKALDSVSNVFNNTPSNHSLWKVTKAGVESYITIISITLSPSQVDNPDFADNVVTYVEVIQPKAMETGKVTIPSEQIAKGIAAEGKITLYGIYFDTGKADVKDTSKPQLDEIAKVLAANPALKVQIVGHTDNQGALQENIVLSQRRAEAIVATLTKDYKVDGKRLIARGLANSAPVASNTSETGRAKNRRVEMVEQ